MSRDQTNETVAILAGIGIGAALMYFLDPHRGNARRTQVADQAAGRLRGARYDLEVTRRDLANRAQGLAAEARNRFSDEAVPDEVLTERVRAELGHHVDSVRRIEISAAAGRVTLRGAVGDQDRDDIVNTVRHVRGVEEVDDQMR
jgi:osmotically-inducible protein OsmY